MMLHFINYVGATLILASSYWPIRDNANCANLDPYVKERIVFKFKFYILLQWRTHERVNSSNCPTQVWVLYNCSGIFKKKFFFFLAESIVLKLTIGQYSLVASGFGRFNFYLTDEAISSKVPFKSCTTNYEVKKWLWIWKKKKNHYTCRKKTAFL